MFKRLLRAGICLVVALSAYWAYAVVVVPLVEPSVRPRNTEIGPVVVTDPELDKFFPEGSWERDKPKKIESDQFFLLFRDYKPNGPKSIKVEPVTLIYFPENDRDRRQPIIMQAPEGAIVESDDPINLAQAVFKPVRARMPGEVYIRRGRSSPNQDDELYVATKSIQIDRKRIWTPQEVEFRFGPHWGRGRDLQIRLHDRDSNSTPLGKEVASIRDLELAQVDKVFLQTGDGLLAGEANHGDPATDSNNSAENTAQAEPPIEVHCDGSFRFDLVGRVASLTDNVRLTRDYQQFVDSLSCSLLELHFGEGTKATDAPDATSVEPGPNQAESGKLAIEKFLATGSPVVLEAPSEQAYARAERVECLYAERRIIVDSKRGAWLRHQQTEMEAPHLDYTLHPQDQNRPGILIAEGAGRIRGLSEESNGKAFQATWTERLHLRPHENQHVLSLYQRAAVEFVNMGGFSADEIHLYLEETDSEPDILAGNDSGEFIENKKHTQDKFQLRPTALFAQRNVVVDSLWLQSKAPSNELKVWFVPKAEAITDIEPESSGATEDTLPTIESSEQDQAVTEDSSSSAPKPPAGPPLEFQGEQIEARVISGDSMKLDDITVAGGVRIARAASKPGESPLVITGNMLHVMGASEGRATVEVLGEPAEAGGQGMVLRGAQIILDQEQNLMTMPGNGEMRTEPRQVQGQKGGLPGLLITWNEGLEFDGLVAKFHGHVRVSGKSNLENGDVATFQINGRGMHAELTRQLSFVKPQSDSDNSEVGLAVLTFPGQVAIENRTKNSQGELQSWEEMNVLNLRLDHRTGDLTAQGPGHLSSVRRGGQTPGNIAPGSSALSRITNIQVDYHRCIVGNIVAREVEFFERVHALYGPVKGWKDRLNSDLGPLGPEAFSLDSDQLKLTEMASADDLSKSHHELLATKNVVVHGESFHATGQSLKYDDSKALLILEGSLADPAILQASWQKGSVAARSIKLWPRDKRFTTEDVVRVDINLGTLPGIGKKR